MHRAKSSTAAGSRQHPDAALELWAGIECTLNRVEEQYFSQMHSSGHDRRPEDIDLIAELGIKTIRYPVLWEHIAPHGVSDADWRWSDDRLKRLTELGITPIAGLLHHGSGPKDTDLLDPAFANKFRLFARAVAERYPWLSMYTPINEPLTTARFSALYGFWYPHARDDRSFVRAVLNQCRGIALAMEEIRRVNPHAQLIQTDDLGYVDSTPALAYQAEFENERRWLAFDLLCGHVTASHRLTNWLLSCGVTEAELFWFAEHPCVPDIFGFNYYITGERFLDERLDRYPSTFHGGNHRQAYADVEAVRVKAEGITGPERLLRDAWDRYGRPLAVTEVQLACTADEQIRWFWEVWRAAALLKRQGVDIRAVTAWAMLGAFDWDCLVTECRGRYESGAFAICDGRPEPTPLAEFLCHVAAGRQPDHPALLSPGWWRRSDRIHYPIASERADSDAPR